MNNNTAKQKPNGPPPRGKKRRPNRRKRNVRGGTFQGTFQAPQMRQVQRDATGVIDHEPVPLQVPQYLQVRESTSFKLNAKGCLTSSAASALTVNSEVEGVFARLSWRGPNRYTSVLGKTRFDQRGNLVAITSTTIRWHNQLDCKLEVRSNTPKARMPHPGNIAYRTPEQIHEVGPFETLVIEQKWANNNADCPYEEMQSAIDESRPTFSSEYPLLDFYVIKPDNVPQSQVAIKDDSEAFKVTAVINYTVVRTPSILFDSKTSGPITESPNFFLKDLAQFSRMYEIDPAPVSVEGGDTILTAKPITISTGQWADAFIPQIVNATIGGKEYTTYTLASYVGGTGTVAENGVLTDFWMTEHGSMLKYPVPLRHWDTGAQTSGPSFRQHFIKLEGDNEDFCSWDFEASSGVVGNSGKSSFIWVLADSITYEKPAENIHAIDSSQEKGQLQTPTGVEYGLRGVRVVRNDNEAIYRKERFVGGLLAGFMSALRIVGVIGSVAQIIERSTSEIKARVIGKGRR